VSSPDVRSHPRSAAEIEHWIRLQMAELLGVSIAEVDVQRPFSDYAVDSVTTLRLTGQMEQWLGGPLPPTLFWDHPCIQDLAVFLAMDGQGAAAPDDIPAAS
jgi:acyl carrier protein